MTKTTLGHRSWTGKGLALLAATLLLPSLLAACDVEQKSVEDYLTRAEEFRKKGDLNASIIEAKNALQVDAGRQDARFILGVNYLDLGAWSAAEAMLEKVMKDKGVLEYATIPPLARAKIALAKFDQVLEFAEVKEGMKGSLKAEVLVARGQALNATGKREDAKKHFEEAIREDPASYGAYLGLAAVAVAEDDSARARQMLAKASDIAPEAIDVLLFRGHLEFRDKNYEASREAFKALVRKRPERPDFHLGQARAEIALGENEQAIKSLAYPLKVGAQHPQTNYFRALVAYRMADYQGAMTHAEIVLNRVPGDIRAQLLAGAAAFALERYEIALDKLRRILEKAPELDLARELLGLSQLRLNKAKDAYATLASLADDEAASASVLQLVGNAAILSNDLKAGADYLERVLTVDPDNDHARAMLAKTRIDSGDIDRGIEELKRAVDGTSSIPRAEIVLVVSLIKAKRYAEAATTAKKFAEKWPDSAIAHSLLGTALLGTKQIEDARAAFAKAVELEPGRPDASTNLAVLAEREGRLDEAAAHLRSALEQHPAHERTLTRLWRLEQRREKLAEMEPLLDAAIQAAPTAVVPRYLLGTLYVATNRLQKALATVAPALRDAPNHRGLIKIAGIAYLGVGDLSNAAAMFRRYLEKYPDAALVWRLLARTYNRGGDIQRAAQALEKLVELQPQDAAARLSLARALIRLKEFDAAETQIAHLKKQMPDSGSLLMISGDLMVARGKLREAIALYSDPSLQRTGPIVNKIAQLQWALGEKEEAIRTLEQWTEQNPSDSINKVFYGSYLLSAGRGEDAQRVFRDLVKEKPDSWVAHNEIAWTLYRSGNAVEALPYAQRAWQLAPGNASVSDTLGMIQLQLGNYPQAVLLLREAAKRLPNRPQLRLHLAQALIKNNMIPEARRVLTEIVEGTVDFEGRAEATALLQTLRDG